MYENLARRMYDIKKSSIISYCKLLQAKTDFETIFSWSSGTELYTLQNVRSRIQAEEVTTALKKKGQWKDVTQTLLGIMQ